MFCRRALQRVGPLFRKALKPTLRGEAPVRRMAFGIPGGSTNMTYFLLCGGGLTAAVVYAYKTVSGDSERYEDRLASMGSTAKASSAEAASEIMVPAPEPTLVEEAALATEVVADSVPAPAEEVAETNAAEPVLEAVSEEASEVVVSETPAEAAVAEEAPPSPTVTVEALPEAVPNASEDPITVESLEGAPAIESPASEIAGMATLDEVAIAVESLEEAAEPPSIEPPVIEAPAAESAGMATLDEVPPSEVVSEPSALVAKAALTAEVAA